jgi:hypothetical protein
MKSNEDGSTLKHPETINGNVKNLSKSDVKFSFIFHFHKAVGSTEREWEAQIFKNLRERERFGSVFYTIHKKYIF